MTDRLPTSLPPAGTICTPKEELCIRNSYSIAHPMVDAGEDIRWVPRRLVSSVGIPGNDFYLFDGRLVVLLHYTGDGLNAGYETSTDLDAIELCQSAFQAVWKVALPHGEYQPQ